MAAAAAAGLGAYLTSLSASTGVPGTGAPMPPTSVLPRLPAGSDGGANGGSGSGSGTGGPSGRGVQGGVAAALIAHHTLILLRLARCAAAKPIWRSYLPEVPPA